MLNISNDDDAWILGEVGALTDCVEFLKPSEWAEQYRYLPASVTPLPGFYSYGVAPYLKEIVDCLDFRSNVREVSLKKGAQIGATVGILENCIGYGMHQLKTAPMMLLTADAELAKLRMESYITPMIQQSGLEGLIRSSDEGNARKTGKTDSKIEWLGGGFLVPFGAKNAAKLRSISIQYLLEDENDGYPDIVGRDGDPAKLAEGRTKAYHQTRKIVRTSTPLIKGQSRIDRNFKDGDQRYYNVVCKECGELQVLKFQGENEDGKKYGLTWETQDGILIPESVFYVCKFCGCMHVNSDKIFMMAEKNGARWVPTSNPVLPDIRSYHLSALYAPAGMYPWEAVVQSYLDAWNIEENKVRDTGLLQEFYNNDLGEVFEIRGEKLRFDVVSAHRRKDYQYGEIPNEHAKKYCGSPVLLLTCAVDVHGDNLAVAVFGWARGARSYLIDYWRFEGDTEQLDDKGTWGRLRDLIENTEYVSDDGKSYYIQTTFVDSGYRTDVVYQFCKDYGSGVYPIKGRDMPAKGASLREFSEFKTTLQTVAFGVTVDIYKDRWHSALRRSWDGISPQPVNFFNAPVDTTDKQIKELTVEQKREKIEKSTGKRLGFEWYRPSSSKNELWDLLIYNSCILEVVAYDLCVKTLEMEYINWPAFYDHIENEELYFSSG